MDMCGVLCSITAILVVKTPQVTASDINYPRNGTATTPTIGNGSVSQKHSSGNITETTPTVAETSPISNKYQSDTTNNNNIGNATQATVSSTGTPLTIIEVVVITASLSSIPFGLCFLISLWISLRGRLEIDYYCSLCRCCKDYDDCELCQGGCKDWFSDCCQNCFSRCVCISEPVLLNTNLLEDFHFIPVHLPDGQSLRMPLKRTDKVRVIKNRVIELVNLPLSYVNVCQGLMPGESYNLDEDKTFWDYDINFGTDPLVEFTVTYSSHRVLVQFADDSLEEQSWDPFLTVGDFFNMIDLKPKAIRTCKDKSLIVVQWVGRHTLQELSECDKKAPLFCLRKVKVSISFQVVLKIIGQNTQMSVRVSPTDTVNALSKNFLGTVIFIYAGTQLGSDKCLKEYGLQEGSVVTVDWSVTVSIAHGAQNYKYTLLASRDLGEVKQMLAGNTGIHRLEQHLSFNGNVLSDEKMLAECFTSKMEDEMDIILTKQPWKVPILLPNNTWRDYQVSPNNNVAFLKSKIEAEEGIPVAHQILQIGGNDLASDGLLCDYIVPSSSPIYLKEQIAIKYSANRTSVSVRWKSLFDKLLQVNDGNLKEVNNVCFSTKIDKFKIGSGNKTEVFLGIRHDGREVAVKRFPRSMLQNFKNEKGVLTTLDSPNIIRYYDIAMDDEFLYLVLELGEFTLNEFISTDEYKQNQTKISRDLVGQILESLRTLHTGHNVIHMDIKPLNVLIDVNCRAKLSDFGISVVLPDDQSTFYTTAKGTYHWVAKEILDSSKRQVKYKKNADIQVAGMLVYYTLTGGKHPFMPNGEDDVFLCNKNVQEGKHDLSALDDIVGRHLLDWMLQPDPELRPTIDEALAHPFLWNVDTRFRLLCVLGDEKEVKESWKQQSHSLTSTLDGLTVSVFNTVAHWKDLLDQAVYDKIAKPIRNGYRSTICGLLRFLRNVDVHLKDQPPATQAAVGNPMTYFTAKLPFDELFLEVYKTVRDTRSSSDDWTVRGSLKEFFPA